MGNIISLLQEIFMLKEDKSLKVGLSGFRDVQTSVPPVQKQRTVKPQALKISELMRHSQG
jgi:hypothetical protein